MNRLEVLEEEYVGPLLDDPDRGCTLCPNLVESRTSIVFGEGYPNADVLILGGGPGYNEDKIIRAFVGKAGMLLDQYLALFSRKDNDWLFKVGARIARGGSPKDNEYDRIREELVEGEQFFYTNSVLCRPEENRDPTKTEMDHCHDRLFRLIRELDPLIILALGGVAARAVLGKVVRIRKDRGQLLDIEIPGVTGSVRYPLLVTYDPAYLLRIGDFTSPTGPGMQFLEDLQLMFDLLDSTRQLSRGEKPPKRRRL